MTQKRQVIRKVRPAYLADFDDQRWPVNGALVVFAACVATIIVVNADFDTPRLLYNGWLWLGSLAVVMSLAVWGMARLDAKWSRRMQLAVLLSLLAHLWLGVYLKDQYLAFLLDQEQNTQELEEDYEIVTLPDYNFQTPDQTHPSESLEAPVDATPPDVDQPEIVRIETPSAPTEVRPTDQPAKIEVERPRPAEIERADIAAPRRSEQLAGAELSRQEHRHELPDERAAAPQLPAPQQARPTESESLATPLSRQAADAQLAERTPSNQPPVEQITADERAAERRPMVERPVSVDNLTQTPARRSLATPEPRLAQTESPPAVQPADAETQPSDSPIAPSAASTALTRTAADAARNAATPVARPAVADPSQSSARLADVGATSPQRAVDAAPSPSITATPTTASAPRSETRLADVGAPTETIQPMASAAPQSDPSPSEPALTGVTRAAGGIEGLTRREQYDADLPGGSVAAEAPRAAARRQRASNFGDPGPSIDASQPVEVARSRAEAPAPQTALPHQDVTVADAAGTRRPREADASSSVAVERRASSAPRGAIAANTGVSTLDFSRSQPAATAGAARSSGGGEPSISTSNQPTRARATEGPIQVAAAAADSGRETASPAASAGSTAAQANGASSTSADARPTSGNDRIRAAAAIPSGAARPLIASGGSPAETGQLAGGATEKLAPTRAGAPGGEAVEIADASSGDALARQPAALALPSGLAQEDAPGLASAAGQAEQGAGDARAPGDAVAAPSRSATALPVRTTAPPGAGGLAADALRDPGLPSRRARPESEVIHSSVQRFILERAGGTPPAIEAEASTGPINAYKQRDPEQREEFAKRRGGTEGSERAVEMGLDFLARHQLPDGRWSLHNFGAARPGYQNTGAGTMQADSAATGLALLSFLGAGYTHTDGKYRLVVDRGLNHLLVNQKADGDLYTPQDEASARNVWLYSHGIAAIALCEAYGMTRDPALRDPAQRALDFIVASQSSNEGGWRYAPRVGTDTSVSGWQVMALKSGELAGLEVPRPSLENVHRWLDHAQGPGGHPAFYAYRPRSNQPSQNRPSRAMTAEALLMRLYLGWNRDNDYLSSGADYLKDNPPSMGSPRSRQRDVYYWYYASQVMFQMQGEHWEAWNTRMRPLLEQTQVQTGQFAGSWDPAGPTPDRWGAHGGRIYVTCLDLLILEVYYRHLPLYQDLN